MELGIGYPRPTTFAAAVPICGGGILPSSAIVKTPVWVFHGDEDELVNVSESRRMIDALKKAGGQPRYTEQRCGAQFLGARFQ